MRLLRSILVALVIPLLFAAKVHAGDYEDGWAAYNRGDYETALNLLRPLAEQGYYRGQFMLGSMYYKGVGVPQDVTKAAKWYRKAAEQGDNISQFILGTMYDNGEGVSEDDAEAVKWYRLAADQGNDSAQFFLGASHTYLTLRDKNRRGELEAGHLRESRQAIRAGIRSHHLGPSQPEMGARSQGPHPTPSPSILRQKECQPDYIRRRAAIPYAPDDGRQGSAHRCEW